MKSLFKILTLLFLYTDSIAQCDQNTSLSPLPASSSRYSKPFPTQGQYVREADVMWSKRVWRVIDLREKMNLPLYYPEQPSNNLTSLFDVLKCAVMDGKLLAHANPIFDDEFTLPMTKEEAQKVLIQWDTSEVEDVNNPGTFIKMPIKKEITSANVRQYWIKEDWYFDKQRSVMECKIVGICPLVEKVSESGEVLGMKPLFWIYFPDARPFLANAAVFNRRNDAERMSFDEVFTKRMFASYVYKESNVYSRTVAQYATGKEAMWESEDINEDIFKYEDNLWHY